MNILPKTEKEWMNDKLDVKAIDQRSAQLQRYAYWWFSASFLMFLLTLYAIWPWIGLDHDLAAKVFLISFFSCIGFSVFGGVNALNAHIPYLRITQEDLGSLITQCQDSPILLAMLWVRYRDQGNELFEGQRQAFMKAIKAEQLERLIEKMSGGLEAAHECQ